MKDVGNANTPATQLWLSAEGWKGMPGGLTRGTAESLTSL